MSFEGTQEGLSCRNALHSECGGQLLVDRVPDLKYAKEKGL